MQNPMCLEESIESSNAFSWIKVVKKRFLKSFPLNYADEDLIYFQRKIDAVCSISLDLDDAKCWLKVLNRFYGQFSWKIKSTKPTPMMVTTCTKILSCLIHVSLVLQCYNTDDEWIKHVFTVIELFPGDRSFVYKALLLISNIKRKFQNFYGQILKELLLGKKFPVVVNDAEDYFLVHILLRRLHCISADHLTKMQIKSLSKRLKQPDDLEDFLEECGIEDMRVNNLLKKSVLKEHVHKLRQVILPETYFVYSSKSVKPKVQKEHQVASFFIDSVAENSDDFFTVQPQEIHSVSSSSLILDSSLATHSKTSKGRSIIEEQAKEVLSTSLVSDEMSEEITTKVKQVKEDASLSSDEMSEEEMSTEVKQIEKDASFISEEMSTEVEQVEKDANLISDEMSEEEISTKKEQVNEETDSITLTLEDNATKPRAEISDTRLSEKRDQAHKSSSSSGKEVETSDEECSSQQEQVHKVASSILLDSGNDFKTSFKVWAQQERLQKDESSISLILENNDVDMSEDEVSAEIGQVIKDKISANQEKVHKDEKLIMLNSKGENNPTMEAEVLGEQAQKESLTLEKHQDRQSQKENSISSASKNDNTQSSIEKTSLKDEKAHKDESLMLLTLTGNGRKINVEEPLGEIVEKQDLVEDKGVISSGTKHVQAESGDIGDSFSCELKEVIEKIALDCDEDKSDVSDSFDIPDRIISLMGNKMKSDNTDMLSKQSDLVMKQTSTSEVKEICIDAIAKRESYSKNTFTNLTAKDTLANKGKRMETLNVDEDSSSEESVVCLPESQLKNAAVKTSVSPLKITNDVPKGNLLEMMETISKSAIAKTQDISSEETNNSADKPKQNKRLSLKDESLEKKDHKVDNSEDLKVDEKSNISVASSSEESTVCFPNLERENAQEKSSISHDNTKGNKPKGNLLSFLETINKSSNTKTISEKEIRENVSVTCKTDVTVSKQNKNLFKMFEPTSSTIKQSDNEKNKKFSVFSARQTADIPPKYNLLSMMEIINKSPNTIKNQQTLFPDKAQESSSNPGKEKSFFTSKEKCLFKTDSGSEDGKVEDNNQNPPDSDDDDLSSDIVPSSQPSSGSQTPDIISILKEHNPSSHDQHIKLDRNSEILNPKAGSSAQDCTVNVEDYSSNASIEGKSKSDVQVEKDCEISTPIDKSSSKTPNKIHLSDSVAGVVKQGYSSDDSSVGTLVIDESNQNMLSEEHCAHETILPLSQYEKFFNMEDFSEKGSSVHETPTKDSSSDKNSCNDDTISIDGSSQKTPFTESRSDQLNKSLSDTPSKENKKVSPMPVVLIERRCDDVSDVNDNHSSPSLSSKKICTKTSPIPTVQLGQRCNIPSNKETPEIKSSNLPYPSAVDKQVSPDSTVNLVECDRDEDTTVSVLDDTHWSVFSDSQKSMPLSEPNEMGNTDAVIGAENKENINAQVQSKESNEQNLAKIVPEKKKSKSSKIITEPKRVLPSRVTRRSSRSSTESLADASIVPDILETIEESPQMQTSTQIKKRSLEAENTLDFPPNSLGISNNEEVYAKKSKPQLRSQNSTSPAEIKDTPRSKAKKSLKASCGPPTTPKVKSTSDRLSLRRSNRRPTAESDANKPIPNSPKKNSVELKKSHPVTKDLAEESDASIYLVVKDSSDDESIPSSGKHLEKKEDGSDSEDSTRDVFEEEAPQTVSKVNKRTRKVTENLSDAESVDSSIGTRHSKRIRSIYSQSVKSSSKRKTRQYVDDSSDAESVTSGAVRCSKRIRNLSQSDQSSSKRTTRRRIVEPLSDADSVASSTKHTKKSRVFDSDSEDSTMGNHSDQESSKEVKSRNSTRRVEDSSDAESVSSNVKESKTSKRLTALASKNSSNRSAKDFSAIKPKELLLKNQENSQDCSETSMRRSTRSISKQEVTVGTEKSVVSKRSTRTSALLSK